MRAPLYLLISLVGFDVITAVYSSFWGPFPAFTSIGSPTAYKNMYVHIPAGQVMYLVFAAAAVLSCLGIRRRSDKYIAYVDSLVYLGIILSAFAFISGTLWSAESWGSPWTWEPRQTSILLLFVVYLVYPAIRMSVEDPERSVMLGYVYTIAGISIVATSVLLPVIVEAFHPGPGAAVVALPPLSKAIWIARTSALALIVYLVVRCPPRALLGLLYLSLVAAGGIGLSSWLTAGEIHRVVNASVQGNTYVLVLDNGLELPLDLNTARKLVNPPLVDNKPTIVNHLVSIDGEPKVLTHPSVYVNLALYGALMALAFRVVRR